MLVGDTTASCGPRVAGSDIMQQYVARSAERFSFLRHEQLRDGARRRTADPGYSPRTLHIPPGWMKANKVSEGQRQWSVPNCRG